MKWKFDGILSHEGNVSVEMCSDEFFLKHDLHLSDHKFIYLW